MFVLTGRRWFALGVVLGIMEIAGGNIHIMLAAAMVLGFRWPWTWSLVLLTKITPGIGLLWFAVRREWRQLGIALGATALIVAVSFALMPDAWFRWVEVLRNVAGRDGTWAAVPIPFLVRLPFAVALVVWGARTDRRWTVPVAGMLALPALWYGGFAMLLAVIALQRKDDDAAAQPATRRACGGSGGLIRRSARPRPASGASGACGAGRWTAMATAPSRNTAPPRMNGPGMPATAATPAPSVGPRMPAAYSGRYTRLRVIERRSTETSVASRAKTMALTAAVEAPRATAMRASDGTPGARGMASSAAPPAASEPTSTMRNPIRSPMTPPSGEMTPPTRAAVPATRAIADTRPGPRPGQALDQQRDVRPRHLGGQERHAEDQEDAPDRRDRRARCAAHRRRCPRSGRPG